MAKKKIKAKEKDAPQVQCPDCKGLYAAGAPHQMFCPAKMCDECGTTYSDVYSLHEDGTMEDEDDESVMIAWVNSTKKKTRNSSFMQAQWKDRLKQDSSVKRQFDIAVRYQGGTLVIGSVEIFYDERPTDLISRYREQGGVYVVDSFIPWHEIAEIRLK